MLRDLWVGDIEAAISDAPAKCVSQCFQFSLANQGDQALMLARFRIVLLTQLPSDQLENIDADAHVEVAASGGKRL